MCTGCVQSGLEFVAGGSVALTAGLRHAGRRVRDHRRPAAEAARRAQREAEAAAFLERLDLDPRAVLGWSSDPAVEPAQPSEEELQPA